MRRDTQENPRTAQTACGGFSFIYNRANKLGLTEHRLQPKNVLNPTHLIIYSPICLLTLIRYPALLLLQIAAGNSSLQAKDSIRNANFIFRTYGK